ncbi:hypothetical protein LLEC1_02313 [Akanthomyces lecanii]|uniref:FAD-binding domain-containing protein n=1 Tax=Cordyceps confragosa TaxID=2714763 RepID=A0A179I8X1_CORDF|nr:hypothetical protein LLEC1_02313 [Akanthomyces lecanii]
MSVGIALRRAGHRVTVYEKHDFAGEVGASVSCAANGTRWLHEWGVDVAKGDPVVLKKLINRDWKTGEPVSVYDLDDYEERWGHVYNMFHRQYMHSMLKDCAMQEEGSGIPVKLLVNHQLGILPEKRPSESSCLHANVRTADAVRLGLVDYSRNCALEYWGGQEGKWDKIVLSPCNGGRLLSYYCFFPRALGDYSTQQWGADSRPVGELLAPFPELDAQVKAHLAIGVEIQPWRLWVHDPYPYLQKGKVCLLGDAGHPMMPHQSQGACMAIEDAAALGIIFNKQHFNGDISEALALYQDVRLPRVTRVQAAAAKAAYNINERIGRAPSPAGLSRVADTYKVEDEKKKLTVEEVNAYDMYKDVDELLAKRRGTVFGEKFSRGLPLGMELPNGVVVGEDI